MLRKYFSNIWNSVYCLSEYVYKLLSVLVSYSHFVRDDFDAACLDNYFSFKAVINKYMYTCI